LSSATDQGDRGGPGSLWLSADPLPAAPRGWLVDHKRIQRQYGEEGLNLRARRPRHHVTAARRLKRLPVQRRFQVWAMDFVSDALFNGKRFHALTHVDAYTREWLAIRVGQGIRASLIA
jgi:putative transposase